MTTAGVIVLVAVLIATAAFGIVWRRAQGRMRPHGGDRVTGDGGSPGGDRLTGEELGSPLGPRATLVQFSTTFCAPCRATRRILVDVTAMLDGVRHVEIDAADRLDLVRRFDIRTTPTVLVLGPDGRIARRAAGQPRKADVVAALGAVLPGGQQPDTVRA